MRLSRKKRDPPFFPGALEGPGSVCASPMMVPGGPTKPGASFTCPWFGRVPTPTPRLLPVGGLKWMLVCAGGLGAAVGSAGSGGQVPQNRKVVWQSRRVGAWRPEKFFVKSDVLPRLLLSDGVFSKAGGGLGSGWTVSGVP